MKAKTVNEAIKHLTGRTKKELQDYVNISAYCRDNCVVTAPFGEYSGYVPNAMGIGDGKYIGFTLNIKTGKIEGWHPLTMDKLKDIFDDSVGQMDYELQGPGVYESIKHLKPRSQEELNIFSVKWQPKRGEYEGVIWQATYKDTQFELDAEDRTLFVILPNNQKGILANPLYNVRGYGIDDLLKAAEIQILKFFGEYND